MLSQDLNNIIEKIQTESIELYDQIYRVRDIEALPNSYANTNGVEDGNSSIQDLSKVQFHFFSHPYQKHLPL